jgi:hypothetical protein
MTIHHHESHCIPLIWRFPNGGSPKPISFNAKDKKKLDDLVVIEGSLEVKLPTIWTDEKQRWEESERREE